MKKVVAKKPAAKKRPTESARLATSTTPRKPESFNDGPGIVFDIDGTLCPSKRADQSYADLKPAPKVVAKLREYHRQGFHIILQSARNMRTFRGNVGRIHAETAPVLIAWLQQHRIPFDELHLGKPWPGKGGFYVDDKAIRPDEFARLSYAEIQELVGGAD